jgi:carbon monoxide dehydrogenase subunit G
LFRLTITLEPEGEGTRVNWLQVFDDPAFAQAMKHLLEPANEQNLDRLGAELGRV